MTSPPSLSAPSAPLWAKGAVDLDAAVQRFCAADDVVVDRALFAHDIDATVAHVNGLAAAGVAILSEAERALLVGHLHDLSRAWTSGAFVLDERYEDGHTAIEAYLVDKAGDVGRKVHTGRSRNDQVLVAQRLYVRAQLDRLHEVTREIAARFLKRAHASVDVVMPGYTHLQRAMPMSLAMWHAGHAEGFLDDTEAAQAARALMNASPLGTGAGFGVNLALDRDGVARELGFARVVVNPMAAQNSRGKIELFALSALHLAVLDVRRLAWDLSLYATAELSFVKLPDGYTTGSSLMPNKRNPDVVELLRALPAVVEGALVEIASTQSLPSSYHRDLQATKAPLVRAFARALAGLELVPALVDALAFDADRMRATITSDMHATDRALELAKAGVPFRDAYVQAAREVAATAATAASASASASSSSASSSPASSPLASRTPEDSLHARVSLGGAANLGLDRLEARLRALSLSPAA